MLEIVKEVGSGINNLELAPVLKEYQNFSMRFVAIYGKNSEDWLFSDLGANLYGVTTVAIYDTLGAESMTYIIDQTNLSTIFISPA